MTIKEELHRLVDVLDEQDAQEALDYIRWLAGPDEELSPEELALVRKGEEQIERGEYVTLDELKRRLGR